MSFVLEDDCAVHCTLSSLLTAPYKAALGRCSAVCQDVHVHFILEGKHVDSSLAHKSLDPLNTTTLSNTHSGIPLAQPCLQQHDLHRSVTLKTTPEGAYHLPAGGKGWGPQRVSSDCEPQRDH